MKSQENSEDIWQYATYAGVERLQFQQTARMTLSERLQVLDQMIAFAKELHGNNWMVAEEPAEYKTGDGDK